MSAKKITRRLLSVTAVVLIIAVLGGCWDKVELNAISIITGIGVDAIPDNPDLMNVTIQSANVKALSGPASGGGGGDGEAPFIINEEQSKSISEAITQIGRRTSRSPFTHHNQIIVVGKDYCKNGIQSVVDTFLREDEMRVETSIVVADGTAREMLSVKTEIEKSASQWIPGMLASLNYNVGKVDVSVLDFANQILKPSGAAVIPLIKVEDTSLQKPMLKEKNAQQQEKKDEGEEKSGEEEKEEKKEAEEEKSEKKNGGEIETKTLSFVGFAVFKGHYFVGEMGVAEMKGYRWLSGDVTSTRVSLSVGSGTANVNVTNAKFKKKVRLDESGKLIADFSIIADAAVLESIGIDDTDIKRYTKVLTEVMSEQIKKEIEDCLEKAKELNADVFGFLNTLYEKHPKDYKRIEEKRDEVFKNMTLNTDIKITIQDTGKLKKSILEKWWNDEH